MAAALSLKSPFLLAIPSLLGLADVRCRQRAPFGCADHGRRLHRVGVPFPTLDVYFSAIIEIACGLLLAAGLASRLIAIPLIIDFCIAYLTASREVLFNIFNNPDAFVFDAAFLFLFASLIVFIFGPGAFSLDGMLKKFFDVTRKRERISTGANALQGSARILESLSVSQGSYFSPRSLLEPWRQMSSARFPGSAMALTVTHLR